MLELIEISILLDYYFTCNQLKFIYFIYLFIYLIYTLFKQKFQFSVAGLNGDLYKIFYC